MISTRTAKNGKWGEISTAGNWRINILVLAVGMLFLGVVFRLYALQVAASENYRRIAEEQYSTSRDLLPKRGQIFLDNGEEPYPVAINREWPMAFVAPKELEEPQTATRKIASTLGLDEKVVADKLDDREDMYEVLKHRLTDQEAEAVRESKIRGLYLAPESFRYYPGVNLASQTIGFVGSDGQTEAGRYGIEAYWEEELKGRSGSITQQGDSRGRWISIADRNNNPAEDGKSLLLTLDYNIQYEVEKILRESVAKHGADNGSAIVMEVETGRILAMANAPDFNLNEFNRVEDISFFSNPIVSGAYECGSVFKPITTAIGIDDGKIGPDSTYVDTGLVKEAGYSITNSDEKSYGIQTMTQFLEKSLNTGAIHIEKQVGHKNFADYVRRFGFGERTGVGLPGESAGSVKNLEYLTRNINFYTAAFGQGISVTPLQLASAYAALANEGKLMKPQIVKAFIRPDGTQEEVMPEEVRRVVQEETARQVGRMLRSVVVRGHGKMAAVPGYLVGGKTGTAQVAKSGAQGYEENITIGSFAGFAPIEDPRYVVVVKISNPKDVQWAESTAAPAFGKIMKFLLDYGEVEPTENVDPEKAEAEPVINLNPDKPVHIRKDRSNGH